MSTRVRLLWSMLLLLGCSGAEEAAPPAVDPPTEETPATATPAEPIAEAPEPDEPSDTEAAPVDHEAAAPAEAPSGPVTEAELEEARQCAGRMDNDCVIRILEGRADSALERALLIDAYFAATRMDDMVREMRVFVDRYPDDERVPTYRDYIQMFGQ